MTGENLPRGDEGGVEDIRGEDKRGRRRGDEDLSTIYLYLYNLEGGDDEGDEGAEGAEGVEGVDEDLSTVSSPPYPAWPGHHLFLKRGISQNI